MTQEISALKIQNYEEALERKNAEVKYLQLQLHPHFYLNAITTISSLSMRGENEQIQSFIRAPVSYTHLSGMTPEASAGFTSLHTASAIPYCMPRECINS